MKYFLPVFLLTFQLSFAQVFNGSATLRQKNVALFANPLLINYATGDDGGMMFRGAYGLSNGYEADIYWVPGLAETYLGTSFKKVVYARGIIVAASAGLHYFGDFGLDGRINVSYTFNKLTTLYSGLDSDFDFISTQRFDPATDRVIQETDPTFRLWYFIGSETFITRRISLLAEGNIGMTSEAFNLFGLGLGFYF